MVSISPVDDRFLDGIEPAGFQFFVERAHPRTGGKSCPAILV
jgi:hypothetical protein